MRVWRLARRGVARARNAALRAYRGWGPEDVWNLDEYVCWTLAGMLEHLAATDHGWPQSEEFPTPEDWDAVLRTHAAGLAAYDAQLESTIEPAKAAFRWIADHLGALWD